MIQHNATSSRPRVRVPSRAVKVLAMWLPAAMVAAASLPEARASDDFKASLYFELNDTDRDLGVHGSIDGDTWNRLTINDPRGGQMLDIEVKGQLRLQGLNELFYESAEPKFDDLPPKEFFSRFAEGEYKITGTTLDGKTMASTVKLSHVIPAPAGNMKVSGAAVPKDCEAGPVPEVATPAVISWDPVTSSHPNLGTSGPVEVASYEVEVEREKPTPLSVTAKLPPGAKSFEVPKDFLAMDRGGEFKVSILVKAANGNQTEAESCFKLMK